MLFLINHPDVKSEYFKSLRVLTSGAAPLGYADEVKLTDKIKNAAAMVSQGMLYVNDTKLKLFDWVFGFGSDVGIIRKFSKKTKLQIYFDKSNQFFQNKY